MSVPLDPFGGSVTVGSVRLRTPGLAGTAESHPAASTAMRGAELSTEALEAALANEHVQAQETVEITDAAEIDAGGITTRGTLHGEPGIEVDVPDPGDAFGQVVLHVDESGVASWNFAREADMALDTGRGAATRTYVLPRAVPTSPVPDDEASRGLIGAVGKKLIKVLVFPRLDPLIGEVGNHFAGRWEAKKRPYRVRSFTPDDFAAPDAPALDDAAWRRLSGGRSLLFVHGTFSRAHVAFGGLPREYVERLHARYEGRVLAFDHYTLSEDPRRNVEWLARRIPEDVDLDLDIVAHSRGGLVARVLAEKQSEISLASRTVNVRNVVFMATPNAGTILTDARYLGDLVDTYTNLLNFLPDSGVVEVLEGVITVMKQLAVGALKGLDGLQSMLPGGPFLSGFLNRGPRVDRRYFALASNYEPTAPGLASLRDRVTDRIFRDRENDLVVPTAGVFDRNGSALFPIEDRHVFVGADGVPHGGFSTNEVARRKMFEWLASG